MLQYLIKEVPEKFETHVFCFFKQNVTDYSILLYLQYQTITLKSIKQSLI
jgi:hypothetical protein